MRLCIDSAFVRSGKLNIIGWGAGSDASHRMNYQVFGPKGEELPAKIYWNCRPDIGYALFRDPGRDDLGMYIEVPYERPVTITLRAVETAGSEVFETREYKLNGSILKLRKTAKNVKETYLRLRHWAGRIANKLLKRNDRKYAAWFQAFRASAPELAAQEREYAGAREDTSEPLFSILVPLYRTPVKYLDDMVRSVLRQSYRKLELCLVNASPEDPDLALRLRFWQENDPRIRVKTLEKNLGIAGNTNEALNMAEGDFIALLDHDDMIEPDALYCYRSYLRAHPETDVFYSDEDKITDRSDYFFFPHFKSDFNEDMLCCNNYMCHFLAVRRTLLEKIGGWRKDYDGAQDFDLILRLTEETKQIAHIPRILYHWRSYGSSTAQSHGNKSYAEDAGVRALTDHFERIGRKASVTPGQVGGWYVSKFEPEREPRISVLIPNKDHTDDLEKCLRSLYGTCTYRNFETIVIENNSQEQATFDYYREAEKKYPDLRVVYYEGGFNFSAINNFGRRYAEGEYLLLLNNDVEVITPDLLESLLGYGLRKDVGITGAKLLYPDGTVQHAGVLLGAGGLACHMWKGLSDGDPGYFCRAIETQDVSAVTAACFLVRTSVYDEVGGLDETFRVAFNDVDFCLKVRAAGYLIVYDAEAKLYHYESKSRGEENTPEKFVRFSEESRNLNSKWSINRYDAAEPFTDPYYNPNLSYMDYFQPDYIAVPKRNQEIAALYQAAVQQEKY